MGLGAPSVDGVSPSLVPGTSTAAETTTLASSTGRIKIVGSGVDVGAEVATFTGTVVGAEVVVFGGATVLVELVGLVTGEVAGD